MVTSYLTRIATAPGEGPMLDSAGVYRDTLVLEGDGQWRIGERDLSRDAAAS